MQARRAAMLTLRDIVTAIVGGFLAASVAYAAEGVMASPATQHAPVHHHAAAPKVGCQPMANGAARTS
jgi:hypothetical protein